MLFSLDPFELPEGDPPAPLTAWPNGYGFRRTLRIGGSVLTGLAPLADLPLRFDETLVSLRSVANGGNVQSASGWDIRFEDGSGNKLPHELETYDPAAGRAAGYLLPPTPSPGVDLDIFMFYGKAGLAAPEEDPATLWAGCHVVYRMPDGRDMTAGARHMTASGVGTTTILGMPAALMSASSYFNSSDVSWWGGLSEGTSAAFFQLASFPNNASILRLGNSTQGTGQHGLWVDLANDAGVPNYVGSTVRIAGQLAYDYSPANTAVVGHPFLLATPFASGGWQDMVVDGAAVATTHAGAFGTGVTATVAGDYLRIGAAGVAPNTESIRGAIGRTWVWKTRKSADFLAFLDLNHRYPHAVYGISDEDAAADTDRSPVMGPVAASVSPSASVSVNVLADASDPDGGTMLAGLRAPAPALGTAGIVANAVTYAAGAAAGVDRIGITATQGTKTAYALLTMTVTPGGGGGSGDLPVAPDATVFWQEVRRSDKAAAFAQGTTDLRLTGGTAGDNTQALGIVSVKRPDAATPQGMFDPPFTLAFPYTPLSADAIPPAGGIFSQLYLLRRTGANANLGSLAPGYSPADVNLGPVASGIRFSFDTKGSGGTSDQIRGRAVDASFGAVSNYASPANFALKPGEAVQAFAFPRGQATLLAWSFPGDDTVSVTATWPDGTTTTQNFQDPLIRTWLGTAARNILVTAYAGRDCRIGTPVWTDGGGGGGGFGSEGWAPDIPAIDPAKVVNCTGAQLQATYDALPANAAGWTICVAHKTSDVVGTALVLGKGGAAGAPVVIRAGIWHAGTATLEEPDPAGGLFFWPDSAHLRGTTSWTGLVTASGAHHVVRGLRFNGGVRTPGADNRFNRCFFDGDSGAGNLVVDTGLNNLWDWCEWGNGFKGVGLQHLPAKGSKGSRVYRSWFHGQDDPNAQANNARTLHMIGTGNADATVDADHLTLECLYSDPGTAIGGWEVKAANARNERCATRALGGNVPRVYFRHGQDGLICALYSEGGAGNMEGRGRRHRFADSVHTGTVRGWGPSAGDVSFDDWLAGKGTYPNGEDFILTRIDGPTVGDNTGNRGSPALPTGTILEACTGTVRYLNGASAADVTVRANATPYHRELPGKAARQWDAVDMGPNAVYDASL